MRKLNEDKVIAIARTFNGTEIEVTEYGFIARGKSMGISKERETYKFKEDRIKYKVKYEITYLTDDGKEVYKEEVINPMMIEGTATKEDVEKDFLSKFNAVCGIKLYSNRLKLQEILEPKKGYKDSKIINSYN